MKISKSALDKILSLFVPVNRAQILYKTMKKPTVMLLFSGSCCERVVPNILADCLTQRGWGNDGEFD